MRKRVDRSLWIAMAPLLLVILMLAGCGGSSDSEYGQPGVTAIAEPRLQQITIAAAGEASGVNVGRTLAFTATGTFTDGSIGDVPNIQWSVQGRQAGALPGSGAPDGEATIDARGILTGVTSGMVSVSATSGTVRSNEVRIQVR